MSHTENSKQKIEVADVVRSCQDDIATKLRLNKEQQKAIEAITRCRTSEAGGHIAYCNNSSCSYSQQSYNSCRNRHCPKCQYLKQQQWVNKLTSRLMPGRYFHIVFTIPRELHPLFYINQQACYDLLFRSASQALQNAGRNPSFLGADVGALCVLHTWGQTLMYHPHIHMLVPAGGLSTDGMEWVASPKKFFVPVKALSGMFRGILVKQLEKLLIKEKLRLPKEFEGAQMLKSELYSKRWNVYCKKAFGGINSVLQYLGRYTHRVAISNNRLTSLSDKQVSFTYKDYRQNSKQKQMTLNQLEFVRRFIHHVLPSGFFKIRYVGILATVHIHGKREQVIALVGENMWLSNLEGLTSYEVLRALIGKDPCICPKCNKGIMVRTRILHQLE
ncbi:IS91 family transposase [Saccharicrinis fermentans]|uniref:Putative transposase n=1 Tax=Saccharicrinis fermentans DSM 9555 = JCM 21142 TaxID=869213 RepID=W7YMT5_9BACT|nr:IS91 family transposase [Saccharicrinis fermentans]GAF05986.1 putative transposase [Saccharicrinis fermentans DSM 9555 = JCM 21142]